MVITGLTRNQFAGNGTWVRIPPSPPKEKLFKTWGYTVEDAAWLQEELEKQAVYKYSIGQYTLGRLNKDGQRINIRIDLDRKDGSGPVSFVSGWMVQPNGTLKLNTPYGGK